MIESLSKKYWRKVTVLSACFVFILGVNSCKKSYSSFGTETLSPEELLASGGIDTFSLTTYSTLKDSAYTFGVSNILLGSMHDPKMGIMNASFYSQFDYTGSLNQGNGGTPIIDSVVLSLRYVEFYGNLDPMTFQVYELQGDMSIDSTYFRSSTIDQYTTNLVDPSSAVQTPDPSKDVVIDGDTLNPQLRIRLDNTWGSTILNEGFNGTAFDSHDAFKQFFKGLHVRVQETNPSAGSGSVLYLDPDNKDTKITFYYHLSGDTEAYNFGISVTDDCAYFNHVEFDQVGYASAAILSNPSIGQGQFYAQAFNLKGIVEFPGVSNIPSNSVIHAALLELPVEYQSFTTYYPSPSLTVLYKIAAGTTGGSISYSNTRKSYLFDLRDYIQEIVSGKVANTGVEVGPSKYSSSAERIIFNGQATSNKKQPRLIIKYTTF
jgi:hypothetical protein